MRYAVDRSERSERGRKQGDGIDTRGTLQEPNLIQSFSHLIAWTCDAILKVEVLEWRSFSKFLDDMDISALVNPKLV